MPWASAEALRIPLTSQPLGCWQTGKRLPDAPLLTAFHGTRLGLVSPVLQHGLRFSAPAHGVKREALWCRGTAAEALAWRCTPVIDEYPGVCIELQAAELRCSAATNHALVVEREEDVPDELPSVLLKAVWVQIPAGEAQRATARDFKAAVLSVAARLWPRSHARSSQLWGLLDTRLQYWGFGLEALEFTGLYKKLPRCVCHVSLDICRVVRVLVQGGSKGSHHVRYAEVFIERIPQELHAWLDAEYARRGWSGGAALYHPSSDAEPAAVRRDYTDGSLVCS